MATTDDTYLVYRVEVRHPGGGPDNYDIEGKTSLGSAEDNDIAIQGEGLAAHHCFFRVQNDVISLHNLGPDTEVDGMELTAGKMYILDKGDKVQIGNVELIVRSEEQKGKKPKKKKAPADDELDFDDEEEEYEEDEDDEEYEYEDDETDPNANVEALLEKAEAEETKRTKKEGGLLAKFGLGKKKDKKKPKLTKKPKLVRHHDPIPAALPRLYAFLAELCLVYSILFFVFPYLNIESPISQYSTHIVDLINKAAPKLNALAPWLIPVVELLRDPAAEFNLLQFLIHFMALHLLAHMLFATSLPLALMGVKEESSFVIARGKALFRSLIGLITTPFILFDLPLIVGKRSVKEIVTATHLSFSSSILKWLGALVLLPAIILSPIVLPLLWSPQYLIEGITIESFKKEKSYKGPGKTIETYSNSLGLGLNADLPDRFTILPKLELKGKKVIKGITFVDIKKNAAISLNFGGQLLWPSLLKDLAWGDPLLGVFSPDLATMIGGKVSETILDKATLNKFRARLESSLRLGLLSLVNYLSDNGPFTAGSVKMRQGLLQKLNLVGKVTGRWIGVGKKELLVLTAINSGLMEIVLLDISFPKSEYYQLSIKAKDAPLVNSLFKYVLASALWSPPAKPGPTNFGPAIDLVFAKEDKSLPPVPEIVNYFKSQLVKGPHDPESFSYELAKKQLSKYFKVLEHRLGQEAKHLGPYVRALAPLTGQEIETSTQNQAKAKKSKNNGKKPAKRNRPKRRRQKRK